MDKVLIERNWMCGLKDLMEFRVIFYNSVIFGWETIECLPGRVEGVANLNT